jgi:hypothetical protein
LFGPPGDPAAGRIESFEEGRTEILPGGPNQTPHSASGHIPLETLSLRFAILIATDISSTA